MTAIIISKLIPFFSMVFLGFFLTWRNIITKEDCDSLVRYIYFLAVPCLLFKAVVDNNVTLTNLPWLTYFGYFIPVGFLFCLYVFYWNWRSKKSNTSVTREDVGIFAFAGTFSNLVLLGIPTTQAIFGKQGLTPLLTIVSLHSFTLFAMVIATQEWDAQQLVWARVWQVVKRLLTNPFIVTLSIAFLWSAWADFPIPVHIDLVLSLFRDSVTPVSLTALGGALYHFGMKVNTRDQVNNVVTISLLKLFLAPFFVFSFTHFVLNLGVIEVMVATYIAALPSGTNAYIFSSIYKTNRSVPSGSIFLSSLLSTVTLPIFLVLLFLFAAKSGFSL